MAIDTVTKRFSMVNLGGDNQVLPVPDASLTVKDRLLLVSLYSGIGDAESGGGGGIAGAGIAMMQGLGI